MIRVATKNDLPEIVRVHSVCFPDSFTTAMGRQLLQRYYEEFMTRNPDLFLVSVDQENTITGLCMGYYGGNTNSTKRFLQKNWMRFAIRILCLLLSGNPIAWKKVWSLGNKKQKTVVVNDQFCAFSREDSADLLSICVLPEMRGGGVAAQLIDAYIQVLARQGRRLVLLSVLTDNSRAIRFYEKKGFSLFKKFGDTSLLYAKRLDLEQG